MASKAASLLPALLRRPASLPSSARLRAITLASAPARSTLAPITTIRFAHSIPRPRPVTPREPSRAAAQDGDAPTSESSRPSLPSNPAYYQLSFTCVPCGHRSHHNVSKQGYHKGSTLITCPECRNRHVISDHLGIFGDRPGITVEDLLREKGQLVKRGSLGEDGDIEFWPDDDAVAATDAAPATSTAAGEGANKPS